MKSAALRIIVPAFAAAFTLTACEPAAVSPAPAPSSGAVSADMPEARKIGERVLAEGGNAVDAAVATALALGVENPSSSGLGGGGFAVVWIAKERRAYMLDFRESAPAGADVRHYKGPDGKFIPSTTLLGCHAIGVPGEAAGLGALHSRFGSRPWPELVEPAAVLADGGYPISRYLARSIREGAEDLSRDPALARVFLKADGSPRVPGEITRDPELAATLRQLADHGASAFYRGTIASSIEAACRDVVGAVRVDDLAAYQAVWREPIVEDWRGYTIIATPPPSSGGAVLVETLNVLEPYAGFDRRGPDAALSWHLLAEAMKHAYADRASSFGDPDFVKVPLDLLTSDAYAAKLRESIDAARTRPRWAYGKPSESLRSDSGTTNISIVDSQGNAVALSTTVNELFGSLVRTPKTGILLNNTIDDFSIDSEPNVYGLIGSRKNRIAPGKRPVSSMAPTIVLDHGAVRLVTGGSGGPRITNATTQVLLGVLAERRGVQEAVDAVRIHHQWVPEQLRIEPNFPDAIAGDLVKRGHEIKEIDIVAAISAVEVREGRAIAALDDRKQHPPEERTDAPAAAAPVAPGPRKGLSDKKPLPAPR